MKNYRKIEVDSNGLSPNWLRNAAQKSLDSKLLRRQNKQVHSSTRLSSPSEILYDSSSNCVHNVVSSPGGGVKCTKCNGWYCF